MAIVSLSRHGSACGVAERLKLDQAQVKPEHFQAKWHHLAARKMRPDRAFSSQAASLGGSENAIKQGLRACRINEGEDNTL